MHVHSMETEDDRKLHGAGRHHGVPRRADRQSERRAISERSYEKRRSKHGKPQVKKARRSMHTRENYDDLVVLSKVARMID